MFNILSILLSIVSIISGMYTGPYMLWGRDDLKSLDNLSALQGIDDKFLRNLYSESTSILLFLRNATSEMTSENFPLFKRMLIEQTQSWKYLPQHWLTSDPIDYNVNAEIINLVGSATQQDSEIVALYKEAVITYGEGKVLGILGARTEDHDMDRRKRDVVETTTSLPSTTIQTPTEEPVDDDLIFDDPEKAILYTSEPILLTENGTDIELRYHGLAKSDERDQLSRLVVTFPKTIRNGNSVKLILRFRFPISQGYWSLTSVEVEDASSNMTLNVVGEPPVAPIGFSYVCAEPLVFKENSTVLTLSNYQVQPILRGKKFGDAYNCVGFTSGPIWSGILVTVLLCGVLTIGLICIMDIKPPNRFENSRGKQLTFSAQE